MSYTNAPATRLLATHCAICGRALVDADSVSQGVGPECRKYINKTIYEASIAVSEGNVQKVIECAENLSEMGCEVLAAKVLKGYEKSIKDAKIIISVKDDNISLKTPYRRKNQFEFIQDLRNINGRIYDRVNNLNIFPYSEKVAVWNFLKKWFPKEFAVLPNGNLWRIPE